MKWTNSALYRRNVFNFNLKLLWQRAAILCILARVTSVEKKNSIFRMENTKRWSTGYSNEQVPLRKLDRHKKNNTQQPYILIKIIESGVSRWKKFWQIKLKAWMLKVWTVAHSLQLLSVSWDEFFYPQKIISHISYIEIIYPKRILFFSGSDNRLKAYEIKPSYISSSYRSPTIRLFTLNWDLVGAMPFSQ